MKILYVPKHYVLTSLRSWRIKGGGEKGRVKEKKRRGRWAVGDWEAGAPSFPQSPALFSRLYFFFHSISSLPPPFMRQLRRLCIDAILSLSQVRLTCLRYCNTVKRKKKLSYSGIPIVQVLDLTKIPITRTINLSFFHL